jgi:hypothetical protein
MEWYARTFVKKLKKSMEKVIEPKLLNNGEENRIHPGFEWVMVGTLGKGAPNARPKNSTSIFLACPLHGRSVMSNSIWRIKRSESRSIILTGHD